MAKYIVPIDPPNIHRTADPFDFNNPTFDPIQFARDLVETMMENKGLGLAAPQIGVNSRVIAIRANPMIVMYNPRIVNSSDELIVLEEGCLSYPGIFMKVERPRVIKIRYTQPNGNTVTEQFQDISARIIQHEIDHLDGVTMFDAASPFHREAGLRKLKQLKRKSS